MRQENTGSRQIRIGRHSQLGQIYHITTATYKRTRRFDDLFLGRIVVNALRAEEHAGHAETLAYVVMPDHVHWLLSLGERKSLSTTVKRFKTVAARAVNSTLQRSGPIWQAGFYDRAIRRDEDIVAVARYIVANPLRARLVTSIAEYPLWNAKWL